MRLPSEHQEEFLKGIAEFNQREFFECHETLEGVWQKYQQPDRELIQGIIQVAVGYYHLLRDNSVGALKLLRRGVGRIEKFAPHHFELELEPFVANIAADISLTEETHIRPLSAFGFQELNLYRGDRIVDLLPTSYYQSQEHAFLLLCSFHVP